MKQGYTHISIVLDRSGSMASCADDTKGGFDTFIEEQKKAPGTATLTLAQFDDAYEVVHNGIDLKAVPPLDFIPRGMTALLDAIGKTIASTGEFLKAKDESERPEHVVFVILTDGRENASREYRREKIMEMIKHQESAYKWQFVFLGANQDAIAAGRDIGISMDMAMTYDANRPRAAYASVSKNLHTVRAGASTRMSFSVEDRKRNTPKA